MTILGNVLLVDDDVTTNFYNKYLLEKKGCFENIHVVLNGQEALDKVISLNKESIALDLILLDINTPVMNGFEFLDEYEKMDDSIKSKIVICLLTSSEHSSDVKKAKTYTCIDSYIEKALSNEKIDQIIEDFF